MMFDKYHYFLNIFTYGAPYYDQVQACAWAPSGNADEGLKSYHHNQQAVQALKSSNLWKSNQQVSQWLTI